MFGTDRAQLRQQYHTAWQKHCAKQPLSALEQQITQVIEAHPEYHAMIENPDSLEKEWWVEQGETNPYLHMGMHLAIREQLSIDQPAGIRAITRTLLQKHADSHAVEHQMMECLAEAIWQSQRQHTEPDMQAYLTCIQHL